LDWEAIVSDYHSLNLEGSFDVIGQAESMGRLSVGTVSNDDYEILLEALDTVGKTEILSSPRIQTLNNKEVRIAVGATESYVTNTMTSPPEGPTMASENVNFIDVGVKLYVTPTIHKDGYITLKIRPEMSSVARNPTGTNMPVVETSQTEATVMAKDGVTIVVGGLIKDERIESVKKIPILGDLPLLGFAFRNQGQFIRKTELVIFLTPKLLPMPEVESDDNI
jgi:general secretion pathway protein D